MALPSSSRFKARCRTQDAGHDFASHPVVVAKFVRREERHMEEQFSEAYLDYKRRVRRWL